MNHSEQESPEDLVAAYALGALGPEEARAFEAFLAHSPEAQRQVGEYRDVAALLALAGPETGPSPDLRDRVLERIRSQKVEPLTVPTPSRSARPAPAVWLALAASLLAAVGLGANLVSTRGRLAAVETELAARGQALAETQQQLSAREATLNSILEPGVQLFQLTSTGDPDPGIQLFWDRQRHKAILHGFRLKPVPAGQAYQLWFIKDGKPVPSVTFKPESSGHAKVEQIQVPADGDVSAAAVTVEPEAGSAQPTSAIVLVGATPKS
jgi:anti-sigma-K factor RskA